MLLKNTNCVTVLFLAIAEKVHILMCEINEFGFILASNVALSLCYASGGPGLFVDCHHLALQTSAQPTSKYSLLTFPSGS